MFGSHLINVSLIAVVQLGRYLLNCLEIANYSNLLFCGSALHMPLGPGGGDSAGPRTPTTPPPPRGLRPTVSCQRYEPKEPTGAEGAQWGYVATLPTCGPFSDSAPRSEAVGIP